MTHTHTHTPPTNAARVVVPERSSPVLSVQARVHIKLLLLNPPFGALPRESSRIILRVWAMTVCMTWQVQIRRQGHYIWPCPSTESEMNVLLTTGVVYMFWSPNESWLFMFSVGTALELFYKNKWTVHYKPSSLYNTSSLWFISHINPKLRKTGKCRWT